MVDSDPSISATSSPVIAPAPATARVVSRRGPWSLFLPDVRPLPPPWDSLTDRSGQPASASRSAGPQGGSVLRLGDVVPSPVTVLPAMYGSIRGITVGLIRGPADAPMFGMRDGMLKLGERIKLCASTARISITANDNTAAANANAVRAILRQFARSWSMGPSALRVVLHHANLTTATRGIGSRPKT